VLVCIPASLHPCGTACIGTCCSVMRRWIASRIRRRRNGFTDSDLALQLSCLQIYLRVDARRQAVKASQHYTHFVQARCRASAAGQELEQAVLAVGAVKPGNRLRPQAFSSVLFLGLKQGGCASSIRERPRRLCSPCSAGAGIRMAAAAAEPRCALHSTPQAPSESALRLNRCASSRQARRARRGRLQRPGALRAGAGVCAVLGQPAVPQLCAADAPALHMQPALRINVPSERERARRARAEPVL